MKKIDLEVHFATQGWVDALSSNPGYPKLAKDPVTGNRRLYYQADAAEPYPDALLEKLLDIGAGRIAAMDAAGIDVAVLSLTAPGIEQLEPTWATKLAREANDELAAAIAKYPDRFMGYAALCPKDADAACKELERCVKELGFKGWKTHCNYGDSYIDEKQYWPIMAKCAELDVPIYLHPTVPKIKEFWTYGLALAGPGFGFGMETALAMFRLVLSGVFDAYPNLKVGVGHYGEGLPFLLDRVDFSANFAHVAADAGAFVALKRKPSDYLRQNMWVSTSCNYLPGAFSTAPGTTWVRSTWFWVPTTRTARWTNASPSWKAGACPMPRKRCSTKRTWPLWASLLSGQYRRMMHETHPRVALLDGGSLAIDGYKVYWNRGPSGDIRFPVYSVLIDHEDGLFIYDTGFDLLHMQAYVSGDQPWQTPEQTLPEQLAKLGLRAHRRHPRAQLAPTHRPLRRARVLPPGARLPACGRVRPGPETGPFRTNELLRSQLRPGARGGP